MGTENFCNPNIKRVLILGIYLADQLNNIEEIVNQFNAPCNWDVKQKWIAIGEKVIDREVQKTTSRRLQKTLPKFVLLNEMLAEEDLANYDFVIFSDDDIKMRAGFLGAYLDLVVKYDFVLAQPARTANSYIDHSFVKRIRSLEARQTRFVEIGPLFSVRKDIFSNFFPFDESSPMGWGYDFVWPCLIERLGLRMGIVDATPVEHSMRKPVKNYNFRNASDAMKSYLSKNRHLSRTEAFTILESYKKRKLWVNGEIINKLKLINFRCNLG